MALLSAPDDYGYDAEATFAHQTTARRPDDFDAFWAKFDDEVATLPTAWRGTVEREAGAVSEVRIDSIRKVQVVAQIWWPETPPRAVVVTTHGYAADTALPSVPPPGVRAGGALIGVRLRVRGFPPSDGDTGDRRDGWILRGLDDAEAWLLRGAVADLVQTMTLARRAFGLPVHLHGESFGGGLAVLAAARLQSSVPPERLALGLPTFGDWPWREGRPCSGSGAEIAEWMVALRDDADGVRHALALFDATLHAPAITAPALAKLAERDDTVPAPTAAAVVNALGSPWCERWPVQFGHYDGGLADLRRHAAFERRLADFLDPAVPLDPPEPTGPPPARGGTR